MLSASRVAKRYQKKACGANCDCGCSGASSPMMEDQLHPEGENYMSVQALQSMSAHASHLLKHIDTSTNLPDWVEAKITRASAMLADVSEYFEHGYGQKLAGKRK